MEELLFLPLSVAHAYLELLLQTWLTAGSNSSLKCLSSAAEKTQLTLDVEIWPVQKEKTHQDTNFSQRSGG